MIPQKRWLVGGGLAAPMAYSQFMDALRLEPRTPAVPANVAEVLVELARALYHGRSIELNEPNFDGEGVPGSVGSWVGIARDASIALGRFRERWWANERSEVRLLTSGSTGEAVAVTHSVASLARAVVVNARHRDDVWGLAFNPTHIAGMQVFLQALANGNTLVNLWGLESREAAARCRNFGVTHLSATPTFYRLLTAATEPLPGIRSVSWGGETADERLLSRLKATFPLARFHNVYASTEAGTVLKAEGLEFALSSADAGRIRIQDGRIWVHRSVLGKFGNAMEWFDTGDLVEVTSAQPLRFRIIGRTRNTVNVGGEKVNPHEVEAVLMQHPGIVAARVFGRRNSVTGELLSAELVVQEMAAGEAEIRTHLAQRLPAYKIPRILRFVDRLELTRTGKIKRNG